MAAYLRACAFRVHAYERKPRRLVVASWHRRRPHRRLPSQQGSCRCACQLLARNTVSPPWKVATEQKSEVESVRSVGSKS